MLLKRALICLRDKSLTRMQRHFPQFVVGTTLAYATLILSSVVGLPSATAQNAPLKIPAVDAVPGRSGAVDKKQDTKTKEPQKLTQPATDFIKGLALILLPPTFSDDDDWGGTKKIQSGLNMKLDGLELKTSRRWKQVNHGLWRRVDAKLVDPEEFFDLQIWFVPQTESKQPAYRVKASLRVAVTVRQQQWNRGIKVYSVSSDILTDVSLDSVIDFRSKMVEVESEKRLQILPHMQTADVRVQQFSIRRVSHAKGSAVREFGKAFEGLVRQVVKKKSQKLPAKVNSKIEKKSDRFQISGTMLSVFGLQPAVDDAATE